MSEWSADDVWEAYRLGAWHRVFMSVISPNLVAVTDRSEAMFAAMVTRHFTHVQDVTPPLSCHPDRVSLNEMPGLLQRPRGMRIWGGSG